MTIAEIIAEKKKNNIIVGNETLAMAALETENKRLLALINDGITVMTKIDERLKKLEAK